MNGHTLIVPAVLACLFVVGVPVTSSAQEIQRGHIVGVAGDNMIVRTPSFEFETFTLLPNCRITRDSQPIAASELRSGDAVSIAVEQRDGRWYASAVAALTPF